MEQVQGATQAVRWMAPQWAGHLHYLLRTIESAMPVDEVVHSLHVQAMRDATIRDLPAMQRFSDLGLHNLHAKVAAAGFIRRLLSGDTGEAVIEGLKEQLGVMRRTHTDLKAAFTQAFGTQQAKANEAMKSLSQVIGIADQAARAILSVASPLVAAEVPDVT